MFSSSTASLLVFGRSDGTYLDGLIILIGSNTEAVSHRSRMFRRLFYGSKLLEYILAKHWDYRGYRFGVAENGRDDLTLY